MSKITRIYLKTGIGFLAIFVASVVAVTLIQTNNNRTDMERVLMSATELGNDVVNNVKWHNESDDYNTEQLMWTINSRIAGFVSEAWNNHQIYSSVLLLDSKQRTISRSGYMLRISPKMGIDNSWYIPLDVFCSVEQTKLLYRTFRSEIRGSATTMMKGQISGFLDRLGQWIPQQLTLYSQEDEYKKIVLDFDVEPPLGSAPAFYTFNDAIIYIPGPGSNQHTPTKTDYKILNRCDELAIRNIENAQEGQLGAGGMSNGTYVTFDGVGTITIDGETYYFAMGGEGYPLRAAISELRPFYIFLLIMMMLIFFIVSRGFVMQYKKQIQLEADRRRLTIKAVDKLKEPLEVIHNCGIELRQSNSNENRPMLLETIISKTEQMDTTVRELLTSAQARKGDKDEKD